MFDLSSPFLVFSVVSSYSAEAHVDPQELIPCFLFISSSNFRVGAAVLTADDQVITGCNVENAAFSPGSCAERTAFVKAVSEGTKEFKALAVATDIDGACSPCGVCRQFAREFCSLEMPIYLTHSSFVSAEDIDRKVTKTTLGELLPMSFGPGDLERKLEGTK